MKNKKIFALAAFLLAFVPFLSASAYAGSSFTASDVSIDSVTANGETIAEGRTNLLADTNSIDVVVSLTAVTDVDNIFAEAILTDSGTGNTISDSTGTFTLKANQNTLVVLRLNLIDKLKRQKNFNLEIRVADINNNKKQKSYGIRFTGNAAGSGILDVSIDRVIVNSKAVAEASANFIDEADTFDVVAELTALEDLKGAHVEAVLKDLRTGSVVADATNTFDLGADLSTTAALRLELINGMKKSSRFELTVKIVDSEGNLLKKTYGLVMRDRSGAAGSVGAIGRQLDVSIDSVEVESKAVAENENNFIALDKSRKRLDLRVRMTALENIKNAHVDAVLAFENGDVASDATATFDISDGAALAKNLELPLPGMFEQDSFKLKVRIVDAEGDAEEKSYGLKISQQKFPFVISSIALSPEGNAEAGKAVVATLRFKNSGVVPLEGINAKVSIPELGISSTKFIDQIKVNNPDEVREDFVLKILDNVATGTYTVKSEIASQFGGDSESKEIPVFILGKSEQPKQIVNDKLIINVPIAVQDIKNDGSEVIYPLTLTNEGPDANAYALTLDGSNWAGLRLSESNAFVIKPKESKTVNIYASTRSSKAGERAFFAAVSSNGRMLKQIALKGNVLAVKGLLAAKLKSALEIMLIAAVILLAAIGAFFGIKRYIQGMQAGSDLDEEMPAGEQAESYY